MEETTYYSRISFGINETGSKYVQVRKHTEIFTVEDGKVKIIKATGTNINHESSDDDISAYPDAVQSLIKFYWETL